MGVMHRDPSRSAAGRRRRTPCSQAVSDEFADKGFVVAQLDKLRHLGAHRLAVADDLRPGLLRASR